MAKNSMLLVLSILFSVENTKCALGEWL